MRWFRSNRGCVAWLAVFALACQFLLSFGHVHLGKYGGGPTAWAVSDNSGGSVVVPPSSPQKSPTAVPDDFCAICANLGLAGALVVPSSPVVIAPSSFNKVFLRFTAAIEPASADHLLFNARGPPQA
jgi:hypothetical protein